MISLSALDTTFCVFSFLTALLVLPVPLYIPAPWKNAGLFLFTFYLFSSLVFSFSDTMVINPYVSWCHFVARWISLTNYGIPITLTITASRIYRQTGDNDAQEYTMHLISLDTGLSIILPFVACMIQWFTQLNTPFFTPSTTDPDQDLCFPTTPDRTVGILFIDTPILVTTLVGLIYAAMIFSHGRLPTRLMLGLYSLIIVVSTWGYHIAQMVIRIHGSIALKNRYEYEGRWLTLFLGVVWAVLWCTTKEAVVWYGLVVKDVAAIPGRCATAVVHWKQAAGKWTMPKTRLLPTSAAGDKPQEKEGKNKFGLHSAGTILRPSRRTLTSQYDAMSFKDVSGLLNDAEAPPLPASPKSGASDGNQNKKDIHPSLVFPPPPPGKRRSNTFNVPIPLPNQKPPKASEAYPLQPFASTQAQPSRAASPRSRPDVPRSPTPSPPPKAKSRPKSKPLPSAPSVVAYPFDDGKGSFLELATTPRDDERPLMRRT